MLDALRLDLRYAIRALRGSPASTSVAILSLALGIGANTTIFSLIDSVILKSLPVSHPEELLQVMAGEQRYDGFSNPVWEQLRDTQDAFSGIFAYGRWGFNLAAGGEARSVHGNYVSGQYFDTLGVHAAIGRTLHPSDDVPGCAGRVVLSYGFWQTEYAGRSDVLGTNILLDSHPLEIIGVSRAGFNGVEVGGAADVLAPLCAATLIRGGDTSLLDVNYVPVGWLQIMGRPKVGLSASQATARLKTLAPRIYKATFERYGLGKQDGRRWPTQDQDGFLRRTFDTQSAANGISYVRRQYRQALIVLMATVVLVLLIACANVANLLLARCAARQREVAIRMAIGCSRARILSQSLTESLLLSGGGAGLGICFAIWGARGLARFLDATLDLTLDIRVLAFTASVAVFTGLLFGIAPAWRAARVDPQSVMKAAGQGIAKGSRFGIAQVLVTLQVAFSLLLVAGAGLMLSTFWTLSSLSAGFDRDHILLASVDLRNGNYPVERRSAVYEQMLTKLRAIPGVRSASVSSITPVCHCQWNNEVEIEGYTPQSHDDAVVAFNNVSDKYFETLGTALEGGRDFNIHDTSSSERVAIVSGALAQKYFAARNPLGRHLRVRNGTTWSGLVEIVGIVRDVKYGSLRDDAAPYAFIPWSQGGAPGPLTSFAIRVDGGAPNALRPAVKSAIAEINRSFSIEFQTLAAKVDDSIARERLLATLAGFFGGLAPLLAAIGLYGVMSYNVARRRNEIGIRMALGAQRSRVLRMVLGEIAVLLATGLVVGWGVTLATSRFVTSFLYGPKPNDPTTLGLAAMVLASVALTAGYLPARRASRLDPMAALRNE